MLFSCRVLKFDNQITLTAQVVLCFDITLVKNENIAIQL
jgi:hypothetical protein